MSDGKKWGIGHLQGTQVLFLTGEYLHAIDAKGRLTIPAKLRDTINLTEEGYGFIAVQSFDAILYLYTPATYRRNAPNFQPSLDANADVRNFKRMRFGMAQELEVDRLNRVLIPDSMLKRCGLKKEVAIVGVQDHIEVWDRAKWESFVGEQLAQHDELAKRAMALEQKAAPAAPEKNE